jgi:outer membrane immunogenic protein
MQRLAVLISGVAALAASNATAADMPVKAAQRTMVAPAFSWTGFYAGVNLGYGWARVSGSSSVAGGLLTGATSSGTGNLDGINGGGQVGFNYQTGMIVWGIEGDFQGSGQSQTTTTGALTEEDRLRSFATVRGRVGVTAWDRGLLYVTGGYAWMDARSRVTSGGTTLIDLSANKGGWTVGGGAEWMFMPNWSTKLEYLYMRADNVTGSAAIAAPIGGTITSNSRFENSVIRVGLNYHFGAWR